jgi:hypothetical protein
MERGAPAPHPAVWGRVAAAVNQAYAVAGLVYRRSIASAYPRDLASLVFSARSIPVCQLDRDSTTRVWTIN